MGHGRGTHTLDKTAVLEGVRVGQTPYETPLLDSHEFLEILLVVALGHEVVAVILPPLDLRLSRGEVTLQPAVLRCAETEQRCRVEARRCRRKGLLAGRRYGSNEGFLLIGREGRR